MAIPDPRLKSSACGSISVIIGIVSLALLGAIGWAIASSGSNNLPSSSGQAGLVSGRSFRQSTLGPSPANPGAPTSRSKRTNKSLHTHTSVSPSTSSTSDISTSSIAPISLNSVLWSQVAYPGTCNSVTNSFAVDQVQFMNPDPYTSLAIVQVQCGSGSQPIGLYVYDSAVSSTDPQLSQTLIPLSQNVVGRNLRVVGNQVSIGVSSANPQIQGACCAGLSYLLSWVWSQGSFHS